MPCALSSAACQRQQQPPRCQPSRRRFVSAKGADGCEQHAAHTRTTGTVIGCRGSCNVLWAGLAKRPVVRPTARARGMDGMHGRLRRMDGWPDGWQGWMERRTDAGTGSRAGEGEGAAWRGPGERRVVLAGQRTVCQHSVSLSRCLGRIRRPRCPPRCSPTPQTDVALCALSSGRCSAGLARAAAGQGTVVTVPLLRLPTRPAHCAAWTTSAPKVAPTGPLVVGAPLEKMEAQQNFTTGQPALASTKYSAVPQALAPATRPAVVLGPYRKYPARAGPPTATPPDQRCAGACHAAAVCAPTALLS